MSKRHGVAALVFCLVLATATAALAAGPQTGPPGLVRKGVVFPDTLRSWAQSEIHRAYGAGLMQGTGGGFAPNGFLTRAQVAVLFTRALGLEELAAGQGPPGQQVFTDESTFPAWARNHIRMCYEQRIMLGELHGQGKVFNPNKPITREEYVILLIRALGTIDDGPSSVDLNAAVEDAAAGAAVELAALFADHRAISPWARAYVLVAYQHELIAGYHNRTFQPQKPVTRAEAAVLMDRCAPHMEGTWPGVVRGVLVAVNDTSLTITDTTAAETQQTLDLADSVQVYVTPKIAAALADLQIGWRLTLYVRDDAVYYIRAQIDLTEVSATYVGPGPGDHEITVLVGEDPDLITWGLTLASLVELPAAIGPGDLLELEICADNVVYQLKLHTQP